MFSHLSVNLVVKVPPLFDSEMGILTQLWKSGAPASVTVKSYGLSQEAGSLSAHGRDPHHRIATDRLSAMLGMGRASLSAAYLCDRRGCPDPGGCGGL